MKQPKYKIGDIVDVKLTEDIFSSFQIEDIKDGKYLMESISHVYGKIDESSIVGYVEEFMTVTRTNP